MWTLSWGMRDLVPCPGIKLGTPALKAWSLNLWITREVINFPFLFDSLHIAYIQFREAVTCPISLIPLSPHCPYLCTHGEQQEMQRWRKPMLPLEAHSQAALPPWRNLLPSPGFPLITTQFVGNASVLELCMLSTCTPKQGHIRAVLPRRKGECQWPRPGPRGSPHRKPSLPQCFSACFS